MIICRKSRERHCAGLGWCEDRLLACRYSRLPIVWLKRPESVSPQSVLRLFYCFSLSYPCLMRVNRRSRASPFSSDWVLFLWSHLFPFAGWIATVIRRNQELSGTNRERKGELIVAIVAAYDLLRHVNGLIFLGKADIVRQYWAENENSPGHDNYPFTLHILNGHSLTS